MERGVARSRTRVRLHDGRRSNGMEQTECRGAAEGRAALRNRKSELPEFPFHHGLVIEPPYPPSVRRGKRYAFERNPFPARKLRDEKIPREMKESEFSHPYAARPRLFPQDFRGLQCSH